MFFANFVKLVESFGFTALVHVTVFTFSHVCRNARETSNEHIRRTQKTRIPRVNGLFAQFYTVFFDNLNYFTNKIQSRKKL